MNHFLHKGLRLQRRTQPVDLRASADTLYLRKTQLLKQCKVAAGCYIAYMLLYC